MAERFLLSKAARAEILTVALEIAMQQFDIGGPDDVDESLMRARTVWSFAETGYRFPGDVGEPGRLDSSDIMLLRRHRHDNAGTAVHGLLSLHRLGVVGSLSELEVMTRRATMRIGRPIPSLHDPWAQAGIEPAGNVFPIKPS